MFNIPLHHLLVHFPIALGVFALVYDAWAEYADRPELHTTGFGLTMWAAVFTAASIVTGLQMADLTQSGEGSVTGHALYGISGGLVLTGLALMRYSARARSSGDDERYTPVHIAAQSVAAILILAAAITGHSL